MLLKRSGVGSVFKWNEQKMQISLVGKLICYIYIIIHHNGSKWKKQEKQTEQKLN